MDCVIHCFSLRFNFQMSGFVESNSASALISHNGNLNFCLRLFRMVFLLRKQTKSMWFIFVGEHVCLCSLNHLSIYHFYTVQRRYFSINWILQAKSNRIDALLTFTCDAIRSRAFANGKFCHCISTVKRTHIVCAHTRHVLRDDNIYIYMYRRGKRNNNIFRNENGKVNE